MIRGVKSGVVRVVAFVTAAAVCFPSASMADEQRPATLTAEELRQRLVESHACIRAWYVEYESARELSTGEPKEAYLHRVVAAKVPDHFFHWSTHGTRWLGWREDPYQQRLTLNPSKAVIERPFDHQFRLLSLAPDAPLPGTMPREFLFLALGWWSFPKRPPPLLAGRVPCVLPAIAASPKYVVNPQQEMVRGRWCHILEYPGHDRLYLDCDRGCAILAREVFDPNKEILVQRIESSEHREVQPGIWVPFEFRNMLFDTARSKPEGGKAVTTLDAILKVLEVRLNEQVKDDVFRFEPLPGSIQSIGDDRTEQAVPGGTDYLDEMLDWIQRHFNFPGIPTRDSGSATEALVEYSILGGGVVALIGLFFRRRRHLGNVPRSVVLEDRLAGSRETET